jgi:uncharacterized membrane protein YkoI
MPSPRLLSLILAAAVVAAPAHALRPREQDSAFKQAQRGRIMPLRQIEQRVREHPFVRGATYLGPEFDGGAARYRLKYMRGDRVVWVEVDARNGRVLQTSDE